MTGSRTQRFWRWLGTPFRAVVALTQQQIKSLFGVAMLTGIIVLSWQNMALTYVAARAVEKGDTYRTFFALIQEQMRFNSGLIAWFAVILGLIVFGADWLRVKRGDFEAGFGKNADSGDTNAPKD